jgi:hypothetical protein
LINKITNCFKIILELMTDNVVTYEEDVLVRKCRTKRGRKTRAL